MTPPIAHLDLKSPNVMMRSLDLANLPLCQLIDFGTARKMTEPVTVRLVDNPVWLAPEILESRPYNEKVI